MKLESINILDENGNIVCNEYLNNILETSKDCNDFVKKVNYGITEDQTYISISNNMRIEGFYKRSNGEGI